MSDAADPLAPLATWLERQARDILQAREHHAWLLQGPSGLGQIDLAFALAAAWLCEAAPSGGLACGACASCRAVRARAHPDLRVLMPEVLLLERGWPVGDKAQSEIDQKKRKASREIRVDAMRELIEFTQRSSGRGRGLAVVIAPAERMNAITANALLKTLEEPSGHARFALATHAMHAMLPTVRSRCRRHQMAWPARDEAMVWLQAQSGGKADEGSAGGWLTAAGERPADALALQTALDGLAWQDVPQLLARGDLASRQGQVLAALPLTLFVAILQRICHDLMLRGVGRSPRYFGAASLPRAQPALGELTRWARVLEREASTAEHPYQAGLAIDALVSQARGVLNSAHTPASRHASP